MESEVKSSNREAPCVGGDAPRMKAVYELRAFLTRRDDDGEVAYHDRPLGTFTSEAAAEKVIAENAGAERSRLDTASRKLSHLELNTRTRESGLGIAASSIFDRSGEPLLGRGNPGAKRMMGRG